jgi:phenylpropionate dioxygenase-like ring-hydroxylating dioxygenase large terminal subunit
MERLLVEIDSAAPLREMWYYAIPGNRLKRGRFLAKTLLGEPLVLGRKSDGSVFALRDICPHRGIPLSYGRFKDDEIECCFHGWRFDGAGRCTAIPSLTAEQKFDVGRFHVACYPAREVQGNVWVFFGKDPATAAEIPVLPDIGERGPQLTESVVVGCALDEAVYGLMDPAHNAYVHVSPWWRRSAVHDKAKAFGPAPYGFTMLRHQPSANLLPYKILGVPETEITFRLPSTRIEIIRFGGHSLYAVAAMTPLAEGETEMNYAAYWTASWVTALKPFAKFALRTFIHQDRRLLEKQRIGLRRQPSLLLIDDVDMQAKWYFRLKIEYARARAEGRDFVNPVTARTLRWRS